MDLSQYKIIFVHGLASKPQEQYLLANERAPKSELPNRLVSVDDVETQTGLDFISALEDSVEGLIEASVQSGMW